MWKRLPRKYKISLTILIICLGLLGYSIWQILNHNASSFLGNKGIALDQQGNIYLNADVCFTKYNPDYTFAGKFGNCDYRGGSYEQHKSMAIDPQGNFYNLVYVVAAPPHIEKFDSNGKLILSWGSKGSNEGQFNAPSSITVDRAGMVYVLDSGNARIQKFDSNGRFLAKWDVTLKTSKIVCQGTVIGSFAGTACSPAQETQTKKGVAPSTASDGSEVWEFFNSAIIAVDDAGQIYVATEQTIQKFDNEGRLLVTLNKSTPGLDSLGDMAVDGAGNIYLESGRRIVKLDNTGKFLSQWESNLSSTITSIGVDTQGKVYILLNNRPYEAYIQVFDNNGKLLNTVRDYASSILIWYLAVFFLGLVLFILIPTVLIMRLGDKRRLKLANQYYY